MRVEVNMDEPFRGVIAKYAKQNNLSMPSAYNELLEKGVLLSDVELNGIQLETTEEDFEAEALAEQFDELKLVEEESS